MKICGTGKEILQMMQLADSFQNVTIQVDGLDETTFFHILTDEEAFQVALIRTVIY